MNKTLFFCKKTYGHGGSPYPQKAPSVRELSAMLTEGVMTCGQFNTSEAEKEQ